MEQKTVAQKCKQVNLASFYKVVEDRNKKREQDIQRQHAAMMEEIFGDGPTINPNDGNEVQQNEAATSLQPEPKRKKQRRWRPAWKYAHQWAYPVVVDAKVRIRCEWCIYAKAQNKFATIGSSTLQLPALDEHSNSDDHKWAALKWANKNSKSCVPLKEYVATFEDREKIRVITVMWQVYFVVRCGGPMELFEKLCLHQIEQGLPNMPSHADYGTYLNRKSGIEFVQAIKDVLWNALCKEIQASPWYSLMMDDSTDRGKEAHLIVYVHYLKDGGRGDNHVVFVRLVKTQDGGADAKSIYAWLHASGKRMDDMKFVEGALDLPELAMLRIHSVRWLSLGQVMERMVKIMPALLIEFGKEKPSIYDGLMLYAVQFHIHLLADVCTELNKFVEQTKNGDITFLDTDGDLHVHKMKFCSIEGSTRGGSFEDCMRLGKDLVEKIMGNLSSRFQEDMHVFNACKHFSPKHNPSEELEMDASSKAWLKTILRQYGTLVDDVEKCMGEMDAFTVVLASNFKCKGFHDAWNVCKDDVTMRDSFSNMMRLWEILSIIPVNTAVAERGFSLQNTIKSAHRTSMNIDTLENYMFIGMNGPKNTSNIPWDDVFSLWNSKKSRESWERSALVTECPLCRLNVDIYGQTMLVQECLAQRPSNHIDSRFSNHEAP
ncbi:hypothetical protein L7F22_001297 [Adiantum nelumboides]|nr:hypothetical protein [Adiantum nelumboides]